jgi:hypothetical protein
VHGGHLVGDSDVGETYLTDPSALVKTRVLAKGAGITTCMH